MVELSEELSKLIEDEVREGRFTSVEEVLRVALANLRQNRQEMQTFGSFAPGELAKLVEEGEASLRDEGEITLGELNASMDEVERRCLERRRSS